MVEKFLSLEQVSVQTGGRLLLDNLDLTINYGEQWAISGPSGSGKTVLAQLLAGRHYHTGRIEYYFGAGSGEMEAGGPGDGRVEAGHSGRIVLVDQQHRFKN